MNLKEIEKLLQMILGTDIEEMEISRGTASVRIKRRLSHKGEIAEAEAYVAPEKALLPDKKDIFIIRSPLVGTF